MESARKKVTKTPISYYGGKQTMLKFILPILPTHQIYVEPFFGGGAVYWSKPPSEVEIINDFNGNVTNFYKQLKLNFKNLKSLVDATLYSRETYKNALLIYGMPYAFEPVKRAWAFWMTTSQGFSNKVGSWRSSSRSNKESGAADNKKTAFEPALSERLKLTQIENKDALVLIEQLDEKGVFFYVDPPYVDSNQGHYGGYTQEHFSALLHALSKIKGKFLLSSYPNAELQKCIKKYGWHTTAKTMQLSSSANNAKTKTEILTANYPIPATSNSNLGSTPSKKNNHSLKLEAMITINNYYEEIKKLSVTELPPELKRGNTYINKQTSNGKSWTKYETLLTVQESIDSYLDELNDFLGLKPKARIVRKTAARRTTTVKRKRPVAKKKVAPKKKKVVKKKVVRKKIRKPIVRYYKAPVGHSIERIGEELRIIKRFVLLDGKIKTLTQIRGFIGLLQRAITEKRIRKTSAHANEIREIQTSLIELHTKLKTVPQMKVKINPERKAHFLTLTGQQYLMPSVRFIKSYISLQGKRIETPKVKSLLDRLEKAVAFRKVTARDTYWTKLQSMKTTLLAFIKKNPVSGYLMIPSLELNGLSGIVSGIGSLNGFSDLDGYDTIPKDTIMNSLDFVKMKFKTLGFKGIWRDFIGDPTPGFSALVFGQPKFGKSILCLDFAIYLARNHGRVLYIAREEGLGGTFLDKLIAASNDNPNLDVSNHSSYIPIEDFHNYDFVFIDSITRFKITPDELEELQSKFPKISFIYVSQVTKTGSARGTNELRHNVDVIIEVPEIGFATQNGRFNQGGTMKIFK